ncbi:PLD nuclease N-terminal domain-containing protein [Bifidobacterium platyrrhinorum]|uniref:PLD nuclease N-terminal domain-containing protein n=1 Tax=Bifidobacterium platyrrhinorum TaxID=2661628 RepID=UPI0021F09E99|nr:PLD nuclease N-terminal domain-containing protein [Bifidobacterium platyrrhinorum]
MTTFGELAHEHRERDEDAKAREQAPAAGGRGARGDESYRRGASIDTNTNAADSGSFGWAVLGFFVPLAGIILYFVWKTERPSNARRCRNGAIAGIAANIIFGLVIRAVTYAAVQSLNDQITSSQSASSGSSGGTTGNDTSASGGSSASGSTASDDGSYGDPDDWRLSLDGFGPVRLGMTAAEAEATGGFKYMDACDVGALYWTGDGGKADDLNVVAWLNEQGYVWSISTDGTSTADGVTSSTTLSDLKSIYGSRLIKDSRPDHDTYVVNGSGSYLLFTINDDTGTVGHPNHIAQLIEGNVTADTVPNAFSCKTAYRD